MSEDTRKQFMDLLSDIALRTKSPYLLSEEQYMATITEIRTALVKTTRKTDHEYRLLKRYSILKVDNTEKLIEARTSDQQTDQVRYVVPMEQMYDKLLEKHISTGHGCRDRLSKEISIKWSGITRDAISAFISLCEPCQLKRKQAKKGLVVKPIIPNAMNSRCQVDLIDMQSQSDGDYKFIFVYQDHLTKFVQLRPLKTKTAKEVAEKLYEIFMTFGAPHILQSDNGREFANHVLENLIQRWPECKMVHGKPRHSQSQGSVERANQDIRNMLIASMQSTKSTDWAAKLWEVQFCKNRAYHAGIQRSPYEAMFGTKAKTGLTSSSLPDEVIRHLVTEEDLEAVQLEGCTEPSGAISSLNDDSASASAGPLLSPTPLNKSAELINNSVDGGLTDEYSEFIQLQPMAPHSCVTCHETVTSANKCQRCHQFVHVFEPCSKADNGTNENSGVRAITCAICQVAIRVESQRSAAKRKLEDQANRMVSASRARMIPAQVGQNVVLRIPDVDRGRADPVNIMAVVLSESNGFYRLGTKNGTLQRTYTRGEIELCSQSFFSVAEVDQTKDISLREAVGAASISGRTQGMIKCGCVTKCVTNACKCKKSGVLCNSRCHNSLSCCNK